MGDTQLELLESKRRTARRSEIVKAMEYGLEGAVESLGGKLHGFSVRNTQGDLLMTLRVEFDTGFMVGFVGAGDLGSLVVKAVRELRQNKVRFKPDTYRT